MGGPKANNEINLTKIEKNILEKMICKRTNPTFLVKRASIIFYANESWANAAIKNYLKIDIKTVQLWRKRWKNQENKLAHIQKEPDIDQILEKEIFEILSDKYRPGCPKKFTAAQHAQIIALACQSPKDIGLPLSNWTITELMNEVIKKGIVTSISWTKVQNFLNIVDLKPHRMRYWLNAKIDNEEEFIEQVNKICAIYMKALKYHKKNTHVVSVDEMTGIQALEHLFKAYPMKEGEVEKIEFEYTRHGTTTLIANFEIATGEIIKPYINATRTEQDFVNNIAKVVETNPEDEWIFVCDQLNTHKSESLVKYIAQKCNISDYLGIKGKEGILKSMETRMAFLSDESHRIRFAYTPKHSSWLNQVEIWFSIINRKLLNKRSSFKSVKDLTQKILDFIERYNITAKPFKWTYSGMTLQK